MGGNLNVKYASLEDLASDLTTEFLEFLKTELGACEVPFHYYCRLEKGILATLAEYEGDDASPDPVSHSAVRELPETGRITVL